MSAVAELERPAPTSVFDSDLVAADLARLADKHSGTELRAAVAQRIKTALTQGRTEAETLLLRDKHGRRCAERLCLMLDEIIRVLYEFAGQHL